MAYSAGFLLKSWYVLFALSSVIVVGTSYSVGSSTKYRPVVLIHGLFSDASSLGKLKEMIEEAHPGTSVTAIDLFPGLQSLASLWLQVKDFGAALKKIMDKATDGINIVCYSQGGAICRGLLSTIPDHNVHTFVALAAPLMGQFGIIDSFFPQITDEVYKLCYKGIWQNTVSVCQYWNDPHQQDLYRENNVYLAVLNNETTNEQSAEWKKNFLRIEKLVMIGGPDDGTIEPWQSSHFGFYDKDLNVVEMQDQEVYKNDSFGLRTLDNRGALHECVVSGVKHDFWATNQHVFDSCMEPWLD